MSDSDSSSSDPQTPRRRQTSDPRHDPSPCILPSTLSKSETSAQIPPFPESAHASGITFREIVESLLTPRVKEALQLHTDKVCRLHPDSNTRQRISEFLCGHKEASVREDEGTLIGPYFDIAISHIEGTIIIRGLYSIMLKKANAKPLWEREIEVNLMDMN